MVSFGNNKTLIMRNIWKYEKDNQGEGINFRLSKYAAIINLQTNNSLSHGIIISTLKQKDVLQYRKVERRKLTELVELGRGTVAARAYSKKFLILHT